MVFLIFYWGLGELVRNGWGGRLWNVGGAFLFFLHSLMGKKKNLQGPRPPQATMWLRPCLYISCIAVPYCYVHLAMGTSSSFFQSYHTFSLLFLYPLCCCSYLSNKRISLFNQSSFLVLVSCL